jgi:hypothetical protein
MVVRESMSGLILELVSRCSALSGCVPAAVSQISDKSDCSR